MTLTSRAPLNFTCFYCLCTGQPIINATSITATSISLSWSVPYGTVVTSSKVMWQRDTSGECPDEDEHSTTTTDNSTSYDVIGLEEDSSYSINVTVTNIAGSTVSNTITAITLEAGERGTDGAIDIP